MNKGGRGVLCLLCTLGKAADINGPLPLSTPRMLNKIAPSLWINIICEKVWTQIVFAVTNPNQNQQLFDQ